MRMYINSMVLHNIMYAVLLSSHEMHVIIANCSECNKCLCILRLRNNNLAISGGVIIYPVAPSLN